MIDTKIIDLPQRRLRRFLKATTPPILIDAARALGRGHLAKGNGGALSDILHDPQFYRAGFTPWERADQFKQLMATVIPHSLVSPGRAWVLYTLAQQACFLPGNFWECGVYRGGTGFLFASVVMATHDKQLRLFDTFTGIPDTDPDRDYYKKGLYADTSLAQVKALIGDDEHISYHAGLIPETFATLETERISFAHVDVVTYRCVHDCCAFIYPRLTTGGFIVFDDYGFVTCPGARAAVDEFFSDKPEQPLILPTRQAVVIKLP